MIPRKPAPLNPGDVVAVVAPAGAVDDEALAAGVAMLESAGLIVRVGAAAHKRHGYLAGPDDLRVADLHEMFRDPDVTAIFAARGGYGSGRLLPRLDFDLLREYPKIFVGHSDTTFLLNSLVQRAGMVTFHGPMVAGFTRRPEAAELLLRLLSGERVGWHAAATEVVQPGEAEGVLVGGCLSILAASLGTPYAPVTRGGLLFLEDVNEKPYRIDRLLTQLRQAGMFDQVAGVVFGEMVGCEANPGESVTVRDVIYDAFADAPYPVAFGLPSGHGRGTLTLPFGVRARLAGDRLILLEAPLSSHD
ncbi:LD-carboxypeptidase [Candidatus Binatia bacterium]|nr:LD-carboxypeptidase [Candidatus Binatia bacterium]